MNKDSQVNKENFQLKIAETALEKRKSLSSAFYLVMAEL